jgi:hypothetical protein
MVTSYSHAYAVLMHWNQGVVTSITGPIAVDGMMVLCGVMLLALPTNTRRTTAKRKPVRKLRAA